MQENNIRTKHKMKQRKEEITKKERNVEVEERKRRKKKLW